MRRKRRAKTIDDLTRLEGTEFLQTEDGITFYLEDVAVDKQIYMGDLLTKFYNFNEEQQPLVFKLLEDERQAIREKMWHVVMRGNFFLDIEQGREIAGPHCCRLWFRCFLPRKEVHWLASVQLEAFYFNEEQMKAELLRAMAEREFYMLPANRDKPVIL